jgi:hypothetical protein
MFHSFHCTLTLLQVINSDMPQGYITAWSSLVILECSVVMVKKVTCDKSGRFEVLTIFIHAEYEVQYGVHTPPTESSVFSSPGFCLALHPSKTEIFAPMFEHAENAWKYGTRTDLQQSPIKEAP